MNQSISKTKKSITYEGDKCENERYEVKKINNIKGKKTDDNMMNLPKSQYEEDISSKNGMMNMTLTRSP